MKQGFDNRIVSYEYIHSIDPADKKAFIDAIDPKDGEIVLDAMGGYGAIGKEVLERNPNAVVYLVDESDVQVQRARENLPNLPAERFSVASLPGAPFKESFFDTIALKMGLHEVSKALQLEVLQEFHKLLKPTGKIVIWDIMLDNETQTLFQDIIRKKDELSGFDMLMTERYFFREDEFIENVKKAGFGNIHEFHPIHYRFNSIRRLEQELGGDMSKLEQLNQYIRERFNPELKEKLKYEDLGNTIQFTITKKIFVLKKELGN